MPMLQLDPIGGTNLVQANLTGMFVALFGYAYLRIAADSGEVRPYIHLGALGNLLLVVRVPVPWLMSTVPVNLPMLIAADFGFAVLFLDFLRRTA
jgi:hypothetical protein